MPIRVQQGLPAVDQLAKENIIVDSPNDNQHHSGHTLKIGLLNLMPLKERTELDFLRLFSNTPLDVEIEFVETSTYRSTHTPHEHLDKFYKKWTRIKNRRFDGFIITGAPVEHLDFEDVLYWKELEQIMDWCHENVASTLYICWAAQAALYHFHKINKYPLSKKLSGIYSHVVKIDNLPLYNGFDDEFYVPHSRFSEIRKEDILNRDALKIVSESPDAGIHCVMTHDGKEIFVTGHAEYAPDTLDFEYHRDLKKGLDPQIPANYYRDDNPENGYVVRWRCHAHNFFNNWLNYYVNRSVTNKDNQKKS